jgi:hypothetical protein
MELKDYFPTYLINTDLRYNTGPASKYFDKEATHISKLDSDELKDRIRNFKGRFKLDFDEKYLNSLSVDRLRHILLAALINAKPPERREKD